MTDQSNQETMRAFVKSMTTLPKYLYNPKINKMNFFGMNSNTPLTFNRPKYPPISLHTKSKILSYVESCGKFTKLKKPINHTNSFNNKFAISSQSQSKNYDDNIVIKSIMEKLKDIEKPEQRENLLIEELITTIKTKKDLETKCLKNTDLKHQQKVNSEKSIDNHSLFLQCMKPLYKCFNSISKLFGSNFDLPSNSVFALLI